MPSNGGHGASHGSDGARCDGRPEIGLALRARRVGSATSADQEPNLGEHQQNFAGPNSRFVMCRRELESPVELELAGVERGPGWRMRLLESLVDSRIESAHIGIPGSDRSVPQLH